MILNSEDTDVRVINKENAEVGINICALRVRMVWKRTIVRLGTRIVIIHISYKHAANLH